MNSRKIALIGDSVLDNFYWLQNPKNDLRQQVSMSLSNSTVYNLAVDESKIEDVYKGIQPCERIQRNRKYPYPIDNEGYVNPLEITDQNPVDYIVCSIGTNEGQEHMNKFVLGSQYFLNAVMKDGFEERYEYLMKRISVKSSKSILVLAHKPHKSMFEHFRKSVGWGMQYIPVENIFGFEKKIEEVYQHFRKIYKKYARLHKFAIIDLYKTLNPENDSHYSSHSPKELSDISSNTLARLIAHIINYHDFNSECKSYFAPDCGDLIFFE